MVNKNTSSQISIQITDWSKKRDELTKIRRIVFIEEQKVPEDMEWDEYDDSSTHFIVTLDGESVATARLKPDGQIGRMAVLAEYRNQGIGRQLLQFVIQDAIRQNIDHIYLHAQVTAIPFYEKQGFITQGDEFREADIAHREMHLKIKLNS